MSKNERRGPKPIPESLDPTAERRRPGFDRRDKDNPETADPKVQGSVAFDVKGNAVWEWRLDAPRRRDEDPTIDFLKALDIGGLEIAEDDDNPSKPDNQFNPYAKTKL